MGEGGAGAVRQPQAGVKFNVQGRVTLGSGATYEYRPGHRWWYKSHEKGFTEW